MAATNAVVETATDLREVEESDKVGHKGQKCEVIITIFYGAGLIQKNYSRYALLRQYFSPKKGFFAIKKVMAGHIEENWCFHAPRLYEDGA